VWNAFADIVAMAQPTWPLAMTAEEMHFLALSAIFVKASTHACTHALSVAMC
jgi:hypothetical protein